jgi:uncharacterized protein YuzE
VPYVRTVRTKSGATAVQVVWSSRRGSREIEHLGSAHDEQELEALKAAAQQRIAAGQLELDLGVESAGGGPLPITSSRMGHLADALERAYQVLGFEEAADGDDMFRHLVLARIIEPVSKLDSLRVLDELAQLGRYPYTDGRRSCERKRTEGKTEGGAALPQTAALRSGLPSAGARPAGQNRRVRITYDPAADAAYVYLTGERLARGRTSIPAAPPEGVRAFIVLDWKDDRLVGIEILDASSRLHPDLLEEAEILG